MTRTRKQDTDTSTHVNGSVRPEARTTKLAPEAALGAGHAGAGQAAGRDGRHSAAEHAPASGHAPGHTPGHAPGHAPGRGDGPRSATRSWVADIDEPARSVNVDEPTRPASLGVGDGFGLDDHDFPPRFPDLSAIGAIAPGVNRSAGLQMELGWAEALRRIARVTAWGLPLAMACFALAGMWGWPKTSSPAPATWLAVDVVGLILAVVGVIGLTGLFAPTPGRRWALVSLYTGLSGALLVAPVLGLLGVARPSLSREAQIIGANNATNLQNALFDATVSRWLGVCGLVLLAVAFLALACAVMASGVLNRNDGFLLIGADAIAVSGAYLAWQFLLVIAAMVALAATLGIAWTTVRLNSTGRLPAADR